jgi:hypothetical protein
MSKKFKITEEQLKRLVINNKTIQEQQESQDMNEFTSVGMLEMMLAKELAPTVVHTIKSNDPNSVLNVDMFLRALRYEIENYKPEDDVNVEDKPKYDIPGMEDVMAGLDKLKIREEEPINESIVGYKNEFDRYLKSPKQ